MGTIDGIDLKIQGTENTSVQFTKKLNQSASPDDDMYPGVRSHRPTHFTKAESIATKNKPPQ